MDPCLRCSHVRGKVAEAWRGGVESVVHVGMCKTNKMWTVQLWNRGHPTAEEATLDSRLVINSVVRHKRTNWKEDNAIYLVIQGRIRFWRRWYFLFYTFESLTHSWKEIHTSVIKYLHPGRCGSVGWALACKPKCYRFSSRSEHVLELQARSPVGGVWEATNQCSSSSLAPSFPLSLVNK